MPGPSVGVTPGFPPAPSAAGRAPGGVGSTGVPGNLASGMPCAAGFPSRITFGAITGATPGTGRGVLGICGRFRLGGRTGVTGVPVPLGASGMVGVAAGVVVGGFGIAGARSPGAGILTPVNGGTGGVGGVCPTGATPGALTPAGGMGRDGDSGGTAAVPPTDGVVGVTGGFAGATGATGAAPAMGLISGIGIAGRAADGNGGTFTVLFVFSGDGTLGGA